MNCAKSKVSCAECRAYDYCFIRRTLTALEKEASK